MTCFEKLKELRPNWLNSSIEDAALCFCPGEFGLREPNCIGPTDLHDCIECWECEACEEE